MRLVDGLDLGHVIARDGPLQVGRAVALVAQAAQALDAAHAAQLVHRDVKPSNLLVTAQDFVYLVDFGIAHTLGRYTDGPALTATGATVGTLDYMAPERFLGRQVDARADVYALACVLYECLTGRRPFAVEDPPALMYAHLTLPPPQAGALRQDVPPALDELIARGMAKDPQDRYATAGALAADAARALRTGSMQPAHPPIPAQQAIPIARPIRTRQANPAPLPTRMLMPDRAPPVSHRRRPNVGRGPLVAALGIGVVAVLVGLLIGYAPGAELGPSGPTTTDAPTTALPTTTRTTTTATPAGDLGLPTAISDPPCDGRYVTFVGAAVDPARYRQQVGALLDGHPGAAYLLAETSCSSLRPRLPDGSSIYAVYLGPFDTFTQACAARAQAGGDSYVKVLDDVTPPDRLPTC